MTSPSRVVFWNLHEAALDRRRGDDRRWRAQTRIVRALDPAVLMTTEGWHWSQDGAALFHDAEEAFGMAGSLFPSPTDCDMAVFRGDGVELVEECALPAGQALWHGYGQAVLALPGRPDPVRFVVAHLDPFSPVHRRIEADHLRALADPAAELPVVIGMDANTVPPGDPEPDWSAVPAHRRDDHRVPGATGSDREPLARLLGDPAAPLLVDVAARHGDRGPTTGFAGADRAARRIDVLLVSPSLSTTGYGRGPLPGDDAASDHCPVHTAVAPGPHPDGPRPEDRRGSHALA